MFIGDSPQEKCISIVIVNDDILEDPESFLVLIESNVTRGVSVNPNSTVVLIVGSEGKQPVFLKLVLHMFCVFAYRCHCRPSSSNIQCRRRQQCVGLC